MSAPETLVCDEALLIAAKIDGATEVERGRLRRHLGGCVACRIAVSDPLLDPDTPLVRTPSRPIVENQPFFPEVSPALYALELDPKDPESVRLGEGMTGIVYRVTDVRLGRPVALKELQPDANRARFELEARTTARLNHPNIVKVYECGVFPWGTPFYVMDLVPGKTLDEVIAEAGNGLSLSRGKVPGERLGLVTHVAAVANAIAYAHDRGCLHRDIKPLNIHVGYHGEVIVLDWGLAKWVGKEVVQRGFIRYALGGGADKVLREVFGRVIGDPLLRLQGGEEEPLQEAQMPVGEENAGHFDDRLTRFGAGTRPYMAPELFAGAPPSRRTDVYALGATLYHVLAGGPLPSDPDRAKASGKIRDAIAALAPRIPELLRRILVCSLAEDPRLRYERAQRIAGDLRGYLARTLKEVDGPNILVDEVDRSAVGVERTFQSFPPSTRYRAALDAKKRALCDVCAGSVDYTYRASGTGGTRDGAVDACVADAEHGIGRQPCPHCQAVPSAMRRALRRRALRVAAAVLALVAVAAGLAAVEPPGTTAHFTPLPPFVTWQDDGSQRAMQQQQAAQQQAIDQEAALVRAVCNAETEPLRAGDWLDQSGQEGMLDRGAEWGAVREGYHPFLRRLFEQAQSRGDERCVCGVARVLRETPAFAVSAEASEACLALRADAPASRRRTRVVSETTALPSDAGTRVIMETPPTSEK